MKTKITTLFILLYSFLIQEPGFCQTFCGPTTPTFTVNLTGNPNATWISPVIVRDDTCCGSTSPDKCLQFIITLDPAAQGISFNIYSGAIPPGAMYYQINCGPLIPVGSPICLNGPGPHYLTFCKPGNNSNEYSITSLGPIGAQGDTLAMGCTGGTLSTWGFYEPSITWISIFPGNPGDYNSYLSCMSGCDTVTVNPQTNPPPYIDYQVCGLKAALCDTIPVCDTVRIYIFSTLQVVLSGNTIVCNNSATGWFTANASGGAPPYSYLWSNGSTAQSITGLSAGNYSVTIVDANGCSISASGIILQPPPLVSSVSQTDALCFGAQNGTASVSPSGGTPPYTYLWFPCGCTTNALTGLPAGSYFATVTDSLGCAIIQNVTVNQPALLTMQLSSITNATCHGGANGQAGVSVFGGVAPYTYQWNTNPNQATQTATGLSAGSYQVNVVDNNGCTTTITITISEPPPITSSVTSAPALCFGTSTGSAAVSASGGTPPYAFAWSNAQASSSASNLPAGNYSVTITDAYGCTKVDVITVSQPAQLTSVMNSLNVSCNNGSNGSASVNGNGGTAPYSYVWSNGSTQSQISNLPTQTYSVTITDANGCTAVNAVAITQPNAIAVVTSPADTICPGSTSVISASASGGVSPFTYFWQPNIGFGNAQTVNPNSTTTYTVIITDANGCTNTGTASVVVYINNISVSLNATPDICLGQAATLTAFAGGNNITSYAWSHNLGNGPGPVVVSPNTTTTYSVVITNVCGATVVSAATVIVHPLPQINLPSQTAAGCDRVTLQFSDTNTANNGAFYYWNFGDGTHSSLPAPSHTYAQSGSYTVTVSVTSGYGCVSHAQTICSVTIYPTPQANFTSDPPLVTSIINPVFHFFDQSSNATTWTWNFGDGGNSTLQNPAHTYSATGIYNVKLITVGAGGCIDSILRTIEIKPEFTFYVPNAFTPNGDHINDVFTGKGLEITEFQMMIFDRWGNQIFQTDDLHEGWDGRANAGAEIAQQDVYVYKINLKDFAGQSHHYNGQVNLVK